MQHKQSININTLAKKPPRSNQNIGRVIQLQTNSYELQLPTNFQQISIYSIEIFNIDNIRVSDDDHRTIKSVMDSLNLKQYGHFCIMGLNLWSNQKLLEPCTINKEYTIIIKYLSTNSIDALMNKEETCLQLRQSQNGYLKAILKKLGYHQMDKKPIYFKRDSCIPLQNLNFNVMQGFKINVDFCDQLQVMIDFNTRLIRKETAFDIILQSKNGKDKIINQLVGRSMFAKYSQRMYKITGIDFEKSPKSQFQSGQYGMISYAEYFLKQYKIKVIDMNQPLLEFENRKRATKIHLIPELMLMTGLEEYEKQDWQIMKELAVHTKKEPQERKQLIDRVYEALLKYYQNEGYKINQINVAGIQLNPPKLNSQKNQIKLDNGNNYNFRNQTHKAIDVIDWLIVYKSNGKRDDSTIDEIVKEIKQIAQDFGIKYNNPDFHVISEERINQFQKGIGGMLNEIKYQFVLTISQNKNDQFYSGIKDYLIKEKGISSQHLILSKYLKNKNKRSILSKLVLQINCKLGGQTVQVEMPTKISQKVMLIGIDVYHKTQNNRKSCAGFIASLDSKISKYYSTILTQKQGQELCTSIGKCMQQALIEYELNNKYLPDQIIVFRDGVGENQVQDVQQYEIEEMKKQFFNYKGYNPQFAFIIVNKRISNKFFTVPQCGNPQSGTLVHSQVTKKGFNFYLVAQSVNQGTATPTHYTVIDNNTQLTQEDFWQLTYYQCFNYANWNGPVRVPSVCQYAHKLAYLVGETFQNQISPVLSTQLCFL